MARSSFSQHSIFIKCPRWWFYQYVKKIPIVQQTHYMDAGTTIHNCLQKHYDGEFEELRDTKKFFKAEWQKFRLHEGPLKLREDAYWLMVLNGINLKKTATSTEMKIFYPEIVAYLDLVDSDNDELVDWKSSTRSEENELEYKQQLQVYAWLYYRKFRRVPKKCTVHYLKYSGTKSELSFNFNEDDIKAIEQWYHIVLKQMEDIRNKNIAPTRCSNCHVFCPYKEQCYPSDKKLDYTLHITGNYIYVEGPVTPLLNKGLTNKFSYELKNAYYMKKANPHARTNIQFWNERKRIIPLGFLSGLKKTLNDYAEYKKVPIFIQIEDNRKFLNREMNMPKEFINGITLRNYQIDAADTFIRNKIGILEIGTGGGKTLLTSEIIRRLGMSTLFVVDKVELLKQTKKVLEESLGIPVGQIGQGKKEIKNVTVATVQTLNKNLSDYANYLKDIQFVIFDECLQKSSKIVLPDHTTKGIDEIYNDNNITEVLSYNEIEEVFESKKILRKIKQPMLDAWYNLFIEDEKGGKHKLVLTGNHRIWTEKGYKQVKDLNDTDILKVYLFERKYKCSICGKYYNCKNKVGMCVAKCKHPNMNKIGGENCQNILKEKRKDINYDLQYRERIKQGIVNIAQKKESYWKNKKIMGKKRKGKNNPIFNNPETITKIKLTQKKNFHNMSIKKQKEQIIRFNSSFRKMPKITKPEKIIIDMNINNLLHNKNKQFMYKFKNNKWKIPDFKVKDENKVIEVSDFEHWRTIDEKNNIINQFEQIGINCLYLDKNELYNNYTSTKQKIEKFCYNHKAKIIKVKKTRKNPGSYKYNLEVEDNHNYIANNILVSNCHKAAAQSYYKLGHKLANTEYRLGISGTAYRDDGNDMMITATTGYKLYDLSSKVLIRNGWLVKPTIIFYKEYMEKSEVKSIENSAKEGLINETPNYANYYNKFISLNTNRNNTICEIVEDNKEKKILILTKLIEHGQLLNNMIPDSEHLYGATNKKEREELFNKFTNGNLNVLVSTISIFAEGIDIPALDMVINASANKGQVKSIQVLGRVLRKMEGKQNAQYIDFVDETKFFRLASYARKKAFMKEGHDVEVKKWKE